MLYLMLIWGLGGPVITGVFHSEAMCEAVREHPRVEDLAKIRLCVPMQLDKLVSDVVLYEHRLKEGEIREYSRSSNR